MRFPILFSILFLAISCSTLPSRTTIFSGFSDNNTSDLFDLFLRETSTVFDVEQIRFNEVPLYDRSSSYVNLSFRVKRFENSKFPNDFSYVSIFHIDNDFTVKIVTPAGLEKDYDLYEFVKKFFENTIGNISIEFEESMLL